MKLSSLKRTVRRTATLPRAIEKQLVNQGRILAALNRGQRYDDLSRYEFQIFSQWGEDGIFQFLIDAMPGIPETFIEFGVEDFTESNCRFLMMKDGWSGYLIDGSEENCSAIRSAEWYWKHDLAVRCAFIDRDNIETLLQDSGFFPEPGIMSIDIDGVDWFILERLEKWQPWIVVVEYNGLFGPEAAVSVPYDSTFVRHEKHYSGLYWGASLAAFDNLLKKRGYRLAGTNKAGSNAFFVRSDKASDVIPKPSIAAACRPVMFRDSRSKDGSLHIVDQAARVRTISDLPLVDTVSGRELTVADLGLHE